MPGDPNYRTLKRNITAANWIKSDMVLNMDMNVKTDENRRAFQILCKTTIHKYHMVK